MKAKTTQKSAPKAGAKASPKAKLKKIEITKCLFPSKDGNWTGVRQPFIPGMYCITTSVVNIGGKHYEQFEFVPVGIDLCCSGNAKRKGDFIYVDESKVVKGKEVQPEPDAKMKEKAEAKKQLIGIVNSLVDSANSAMLSGQREILASLAGSSAVFGATPAVVAKKTKALYKELFGEEYKEIKPVNLSSLSAIFDML